MSLYPPPFERPSFNEMQTWLYALYQYVTAGPGNYDIRAYGASPSATGAVNRVAIQAAIDACVAAGGGRVFIPEGTWQINAALTLNGGSSTVGVYIVGTGVNSQIVQTDATKDVFQLGANSVFNAVNIRVADVQLTGGRYALNLNNVLYSTFERVTIDGSVIGIYGQGQNERCFFEDIGIFNCATHGIYCGASNGIVVTTGVGNYPILQKCNFRDILVSGTIGGTAIVVTAGIFDGNQQSSGVNRFEQIRLESNRQNGLHLSYAFMTAIDGLSNEDIPDTNHAYYPLIVDTASIVSISNAEIFQGIGGNNWLAKIHVDGAWLLMSECVLANGPELNGDVEVTSGALSANNCFMASNASVTFGSATPRNASLLTNIFNPSGVPITDWDSTFRYLGPTSEGLEMPSPVISHVLRIQAFDLGAISSVFLSAASGASPPTRLTLGTGAATNPCWESDGAGGWQAVKGDISGFSQVTADHFIANSFRLTSAADYTVTNPTTNRSLDVSAATLAQLREVVGTMIGDLVAAGFYQ